MPDENPKMSSLQNDASSASDATKVVVATSVRYWQRSMGAEQRVFALVKFLEESNFDVTTLFVGTLGEKGNPSKDRKLIGKANLNVLSLAEDWQPIGFWASLVWKIRCLTNWLLRLIKVRTADPLKELRKTRTLEDYASVEFRKRFHQMLGQIEPSVVIVEYVTQAYLVPDSDDPLRQKATYVVDTHDVLHQRNQQFQDRGLDHWIEISREQEIRELQKFDVILAIQEEEADTFRELLGKENLEHDRVVVAEHPADVPLKKLPENGASGPLKVGYLASLNDTNLDAISWFLGEVWPKVIARQETAQLVVAGQVCSGLDLDNQPLTNTELLGALENIEDFYDQVAIVINPVRFGTGLKIKNIEAFCRGKCLVLTSSGLGGIPSVEDGNSFFVADNTHQMAETIARLVADPELVNTVSMAAFDLAQQAFSPQSVFSEFLLTLNSKNS